MKVIIVGAGVGGLNQPRWMLQRRGIRAEIYEQSSTVRDSLGVGINTLPPSIGELAELGLLPELDKIGIRTRELIYYNRLASRSGRRCGGWTPATAHRSSPSTAPAAEGALRRGARPPRPDAVRTGWSLAGFMQARAASGPLADRCPRGGCRRADQHVRSAPGRHHVARTARQVPYAALACMNPARPQPVRTASGPRRSRTARRAPSGSRPRWMENCGERWPASSPRTLRPDLLAQPVVVDQLPGSDAILSSSGSRPSSASSPIEAPAC